MGDRPTARTPLSGVIEPNNIYLYKIYAYIRTDAKTLRTRGEYVGIAQLSSCIRRRTRGQMQSSTGISKEADQPGIEPGRGDKCGMQITGMRDTGGELGSKSGDHVILPGPPDTRLFSPAGKTPCHSDLRCASNSRATKSLASLRRLSLLLLLTLRRT